MASEVLANQVSRTRHPTIGFLGATTPTVWSAFVSAFENRLRKLGWINGGNVTIDYRWAEGQPDRYTELAEDFVRDDVNVIVTSGTLPVTAVMDVTSEIQIVFAAAGGLGPSKMQSPKHKVFGVLNGQTEMNVAAERLGEFRKALPNLETVILMGNANSANVALEMDAIEKAHESKIKVSRLEINAQDDIIERLDTPAFDGRERRGLGLYVCTDPLMTTHAVRINTLAISKQLPTMHAFREYVETGGLMSYGPDFRAMFRNAAHLVDEILRGGRPTDKQELAEGFELVINCTTERALGLKIAEDSRKRAKLIG